MPVTTVDKDTAQLTVTITAEFDASVERIWQLWEDPRQLERWWGPPTYPATFVEHDLAPGSGVSYYMTSPEGDKYHGWWRVLTVDPPRSLEFEDGFADDDGEPNPDMPTTVVRVDIVDLSDERTRMAVRSTFPSLEAMEQILAMGAVEGMTLAMNQIDDLLLSGADSR
jgi:uncharacterized protein YndB with AHSA1/START domain